MADLLGIAGISTVAFISIYIGLRRPEISRIIYIGLLVRILLILIGHYIVLCQIVPKMQLG